jgi:peroxiredoxin
MDFGFYSSYVALWIWAIFQGLLTLAIFRQVLELEKRSGILGVMADGRSLVGTRAPKFSGVDSVSGRRVDLNIFDGRGGVILFLSAHCSICHSLSKTLQDGLVESLPPMVGICTGDTKAAMKLQKYLAPQIPLLLDGAEDAVSAYKVSGYPTAVVLDSKRIVRGYHGVNSADDIKRLVASSAADDENGRPVIATTPSGQSV